MARKVKIGIFSVIEWGFLDQRPQVIAKKLSEWGHDVFYFEPFFKLHQWNDTHEHPWSSYENECWNAVDVYPNVKAATLMALPAHKIIEGLLDNNQRYRNRNIDFIRKQDLDFAIVVDPYWGEVLSEIDIPFFYDHVDDTHQMEAVLKDRWFESQNYCDNHSMATFYIQPNIARRYNGLYIPNGIEPKQLDVKHKPPVDFDAGCLSAIADWFDIDSILGSNKRILIIGPMENTVREKYYQHKKDGGSNVYWIPRVSRNVGAHWLMRCATAMVPFKDEHPVVDYVMPLKLVEYLYLGLPSICYLNKGIEEEFGDVVEFYSSLNWRNLPDLDDAIDGAISKNYSKRDLRLKALNYTWDKVFNPMKSLIEYLDDSKVKTCDYPDLVKEYVRGL